MLRGKTELLTRPTFPILREILRPQQAGHRVFTPIRYLQKTPEANSSFRNQAVYTSRNKSMAQFEIKEHAPKKDPITATTQHLNFYQSTTSLNTIL